MLDLVVLALGLMVIGALLPEQLRPHVLGVGDDFERALAAAGLKKEAAAALMGIDPSELSKQRWHRGLNAARLRLLGEQCPEFGAAYAALQADRYPSARPSPDQRLSLLEQKLEFLVTAFTRRPA